MSVRTLKGHTTSVMSVAWSPLLLGQKIASSGYDDQVKIWDAETYECLGTLNEHTESVSGVAWSAFLLGQKILWQSYDNLMTILWQSYDNLVKVWDIRDYYECPYFNSLTKII